jgi:hypothetical protein
LCIGKAYLRSYDGDHELSQVEEPAFVANRSTPVFDQQPVPGTTTSDLRPDLLNAYLSSCRASSTALAELTRAPSRSRGNVDQDHPNRTGRRANDQG